MSTGGQRSKHIHKHTVGIERGLSRPSHRLVDKCTKKRKETYKTYTKLFRIHPGECLYAFIFADTHTHTCTHMSILMHGGSDTIRAHTYARPLPPEVCGMEEKRTRGQNRCSSVNNPTHQGNLFLEGRVSSDFAQNPRLIKRCGTLFDAIDLTQRLRHQESSLPGGGHPP